MIIKELPQMTVASNKASLAIIVVRCKRSTPLLKIVSMQHLLLYAQIITLTSELSK